MEDYIFLIIAIVISIFGALSKTKKRAREENLEEPPMPRNSRTDPFLNFEMMDMDHEEQEQEQARKAKEAQDRRNREVHTFLNVDMMDVEDEEEVHARKVKEEQARRDKEAKARQMNEAFARTDRHRIGEARKDNVYHPTRFRSTLPDRPKRTVFKPPVKLEEQEIVDVELPERGSYLEDFSIRKAIIYSSILERKY